MAQPLTIIYNGRQIANGAVVTLNGVLSSNQFYELVAYARIKNNTNRAMGVVAKRIVIDTVAGTENYLCWVQCFAPFVSEATKPYSIPANDTTPPLIFSGHYVPKGKPGTTRLKYLFRNVDAIADSVSFTVHYVVTPSSIDDLRAKIQFSNAYPNPSANKIAFDYNFPPEASNATLIVRNLLGQPVVEEKINPLRQNMILNVENFNAGIYFYSLRLNNQTIFTRKFIVERK